MMITYADIGVDMTSFEESGVKLKADPPVDVRDPDKWACNINGKSFIRRGLILPSFWRAGKFG